MARRTYIPTNQKGNESEKKCESTQRTLIDIKQHIAHLRADRRHHERIRKLKTRKVEIDDLDVIPIFRSNDWESRDQYEKHVADNIDFSI